MTPEEIRHQIDRLERELATPITNDRSRQAQRDLERLRRQLRNFTD